MSDADWSTVAWLERWLLAFVLTQAAEVGVYLRALPRERPMRERLAIALAASGITHPIVWFVIQDLGYALHVGWWPMAIAAESFAVLVEAGWLACFRVRRPLAWSLAANGLSFGLGFVASRLGLFP